MPENPPQNESTPRRLGVVVACARADGRWLLVRRAASLERAPNAVGFVGGEIETGESPLEAAGREMREELGVEIEVLGERGVFELATRPWRLFLYEARVCCEQFRPAEAEVAEVLWLTRAEAESHPDRLETIEPMFAALRP